MQYSKEYRQLTQHAAPDFDSVIDIIEEGLPLSAVEQIAKMFEVSKARAAAMLGVSLRALQSRSQSDHKGKLPLRESDRALQLAKLMNEAIVCFGNAENAVRWMKSANTGLGNKKPVDLCSSGVGMEMVRDSVNRLKFGLTA